MTPTKMACMLLTLLLVLPSLTVCADWTYAPGKYGPANWTNVSPKCGGKRQSPINIDGRDTVFNKSIGPLAFTGYETLVSGTKFDLANNGHTVRFVISYPSSANYRLTVPVLPGFYKPYQIHFHWGNDDYKGSEHLVDRQAYPLELHFIHSNSKYSKLETMLNRTDGLLVVGVFYKVGSHNRELAKIIHYFKNVTYSTGNSSLQIPAEPLNSFLPKDVSSFYHYPGSLTTPKCNEVVSWFVMKEILEVSKEQLAEFRRLRHGNSSNSFLVVNNYRPPQPLNKRTVLRSFVSAGSTVNALSFLVTFFLACYIVFMSER